MASKALHRPIKSLEVWKRSRAAGLIRKYDPLRSAAPPFSFALVLFLSALGIIYAETPWKGLIGTTGLTLIVLMIVLWASAMEKR